MTIQELQTEMIDEGAFLVMRSAAGAFSCKSPPLPRSWNPVDRPHVALLLPENENVFRMFLSTPSAPDENHESDLDIMSLETLPMKSIIEVKYDSIDFSYYRRDESVWTKVAEAQNPFMVEVFSHGTVPIMMSAGAVS
jgi:hypothetical protein